MAKYKDTKNNDYFIGTALADRFIMTRGGSDSVDGGDGFDTLEVDHSALKYADDTSTDSYIYLLDYTPAMTGTLSIATSAATDIDFYDIERIDYTGTKRDDAMTLNVYTTDVSDKNLILDGFTGDDTLIVYMDVGLDLRLTDEGVVASSNIGQFSNWDDYVISTDRSEGDDIILGGGDDIIYSFMSQGHYLGGGGYDSVVTNWDGSAYGYLTGTRFVYTEADRKGVFTQGSGTARIATFEGIEDYAVTLSDYSEIIDVEMNGFNAMSIDGVDGTDFLRVRFQNEDGTMPSGTGTVYVANDNFGNMSVSATFSGGDSGYRNSLSAENVGFVTVYGSNNDDYFTTTVDYSLSYFNQAFNGGEGTDTLTIDMTDVEYTYLQVDIFDNLILTSGNLRMSIDGIETLNYTGVYGENYLEIARFDTVNFTGYLELQLDTLSYEGAANAVTVSLATTAQQDTGAGLLTAIGVDALIGSDFGDTLTASAGGDRLDGADGNDTLVGGSGGDVLTGGAGVDTASYAAAAGAVSINLGITSAQSTGSAGSDTLISIENVIGSASNDLLYGDGLNNRIEGGGGADLLSGGAGADRIIGGMSYDDLYGGTGADRFVYGSAAESSNAPGFYDIIFDFRKTEGDLIDLSGIDANTGVKGNNSFTWIAAAAFSNVAGELRCVLIDGVYEVFGDTDGNGLADLHILVQSLDGALSANDFVL